MTVPVAGPGRVFRRRPRARGSCDRPETGARNKSIEDRCWRRFLAVEARARPSSSRRNVGQGLQLWRVELGSPYARVMRSELGAAVDRRLAGLIIARLRRSWAVLKLVPASWIVPIVAPRARRLRRSFSRGAAGVTVCAGAVIVLVIVRRASPGSEHAPLDQAAHASVGVRRCSGVWLRSPADSTILIMRRQ